MNALTKAIAAYAQHAMMTVAEVEEQIAVGNERVCCTVATLRLRFESA
jgi:hypothetical protein